MACATSFPSFEFSGDTDVATLGLAALTSTHGNEMALSEMSPAELEDQSSGFQAHAARISAQLRTEFRAVRFIRLEDCVTPAAGIGFQEFRRNYVAPRPLFGCLRCSGEAVIAARMDLADFQQTGGSVVLVGDLVLS
jgi:hypothetical protein